MYRLFKIDLVWKVGSSYYQTSIDRIDSNKTYTKDNIQLVCFWANIAKSDLGEKEFLEMIKTHIIILVKNNYCNNYLSKKLSYHNLKLLNFLLPNYIPGKPTRLAPIPKPAPERALTAILGT